MGSTPHTENVRLSDSGQAVRILDQSLLPNEAVYLDLTAREDLFEAIATLRVRGAPAIGIFAGYAMYVLALQSRAADRAAFLAERQADHDYLDAARPTAVNLRHMLDRVLRAAQAAEGGPAELCAAMRREAIAIHEEDIAMCRAISDHGLSLLHDGDGVLTHCNAGPLATSQYGTGLGPLFLAQERGVTLHAFCDETRPLLQGARLTTYELQRAGVDCTLICDNMAGSLMKAGQVDMVVVGADRICANGDFANKIGTYPLAVLASHHGVPFYTAAPESTFDRSLESGDAIVIEQRDPMEVRCAPVSGGDWQLIAPEDVDVYNPAFDVTPHELVAGIFTENGIARMR